jgi:hypothetical protein
MSQTVDLSERDKREVVLDIPDAPAPVAPLPIKLERAEPPPSTPPPSSPNNGPVVAAFAIGAVGVIATPILLVLRQGTLKDLHDSCVDDHCPPNLQSTADRGKLYNGLAIGSAAIGVVGIGVGVGILVSRPSRARPKNAVTSFQVAPYANGFRIVAAF